MNKRYIDAYALENRVEDFEKLTGMKLDIVHDFVSSQPTADVWENVKAEWIDSIANLYDKKHVYKQCSNCGAGFIYGVVMPKRPDGKIPVHTQFHNYCPNCGAQMIRGES